MRIKAAWLSLMICAWQNLGHAQDYPAKPIRLVVSAAAGGANDLMGRLIGQQLSESFRSSIVIDNRGGAGGTIAAAIVANAVPDGYTLLLGSVQMTVSPYIYPGKPYHNILKDFSPIALLGTSSALLALNPLVPASSVKELIALANSKPGRLTYASAGSGSSGHLAGELFNTLANIRMTHIPYKGNGPAFIDLIAGQVDLIFANKPGVMPHVKAGKLNAIAITSQRRDPALPDLPTIGESLRGYETSSWWGIFGPAGLPDSVVKKLHTTTARVLATASVKELMANIGAYPANATIGEFAALIQRDLVKHGAIVSRANMKLE